MIPVDCPQLSTEWFSLRAGIPSASGFDRIVTSKGEPSKQAKDYLYQLAGEKLTGEKIETYISQAMQRGISLQEEALRLFKMVYGEVREVGLCYRDERKMYACSPDGIMEDSGLEIKCPLIHTHVGYLLDGKLPTKYVQQVQGSMLVTGFSTWWFMSYYPGLPPLIIEVKRDNVFCDKLGKALEEFCFNLAVTIRKLKELS